MHFDQKIDDGQQLKKLKGNALRPALDMLLTEVSFLSNQTFFLHFSIVSKQQFHLMGYNICLLSSCVHLMLAIEHGILRHERLILDH